jgi:hypothetical protein
MSPANSQIKIASFIQETISLRQELANGLTPAGLSKWAGESETRFLVLQDTVWGQIKWPKSVGRPLTPSLSAGFQIWHKYNYFTFAEVAPGDYQKTSVSALRPDPLKWDAPDETDNYVVGYFAQAVRGWSNEIGVNLASGVFWGAHLRPGYNVIDPPYYFFQEVQERIVLSDFTVSFVPY